MKKIGVFLSLLFTLFFSCGCENEASSPSSRVDSLEIDSDEKLVSERKDSIEWKLEQKRDNRIDLEKVLEKERNDYFATFSDGYLEVCCYNDFDLKSMDLAYSLFEKSFEIYQESPAEIDTVYVYRSGDSFFKEYFNQHPEVNEIDIVSGEIYENKLFEDNIELIGKDKIAFLTQFFKPSPLLSEIQKFSISEDEFGREETIFSFESDTLQAIIWDSDYVWIEKKY